MKAIINGKSYNTETAEELGSDSYGYGNDFHAWSEALYRTPKGAYFIAGEGGPLSRYARHVAMNETAGGEAIRPLSEAEAREWAENHLSADKYLAAFGEPEGA